MTAARRQALFFRGTVGLGGGVLLLAAVQSASVPLAVLALGAAAVLATELVQVPGDEHSIDPLDTQPFSFASPAHLALVVVLGAWPAALLAALGLVVVDHLRGSPRRAVTFNAAVFALATAAGGAAFALAGGTPGLVLLPHDFPAYLALAVVYVLTNLVLVNVMTAIASGRAPLADVRDVLHTDLSSRAAETGLGLVIGVFVLYLPWALVACIPLVFAVYRAYERLAQLRRETARALETFANVVDERDPYTYSHSNRVAADVEALGRALGLPTVQVSRLRWAGRLHDLGKIAVDSSVLNKLGALTRTEAEAVRRHPRLSARMLRRFRLAADEARAVEYHHERYDGKGYYGIDAVDVPIAASFLAVADSFDAMTSDRSYRKGMPLEQALAEIERCAGTHFHPSVARAFVAMKRGEDPRFVMPREELKELRGTRPRRSTPAWAANLSAATLVTLVGAISGLVALGAGVHDSAAAGGVTALLGLAWRRQQRWQARRFGERLRAAVATPRHPFSSVVGTLAELKSLEWVGLVRWDPVSLSGRVTYERTGLGGSRPADDILTSWLGRDADGGSLLVADGAEIGSPGTLVALPLEDDPPLLNWLVLNFRRERPSWLDESLLDARPELARAFGPGHAGSPRLQSVAAVG